MSLSSGYHPQTNGQAERKIQELDVPVPGHTVRMTSTAGAVSSRGPSMHKTPSVRTPPASLPSSAYSVSNPALLLVGRAIGGFSCGLLVPGERESVGLCARPSPTGSAET